MQPRTTRKATMYKTKDTMFSFTQNFTFQCAITHAEGAATYTTNTDSSYPNNWNCSSTSIAKLIADEF